MTRRVVITGMGTVNPLAADVKSYWQGLLQGRSGIGTLDLFDTSAFKVRFGGEVKNWQAERYLDSKTARRLDRYAQFAVVAAIEAVRDSGVDFAREDPFRCGVILGSGIGGLNEYEEQHTRYLQSGPGKISPFVIPKMMGNAAPANISIHLGLCGVNTAVATACASAGNAIADAFHTIQRDEADIMISGGTEAAITHMGLGGFCSARALSQRNNNPPAASRPFDRDRDGFVLSEGAGVIVLEDYEHARKRGAPIYAEFLGAGSSANAHNITAPHPEGIGAIRAMQLGLKEARLAPVDIQYINAHGTSTELGDAAETHAVRKVFGDHADRLAISSTKSMVGHLLGASGGVEIIATILSIKHGVVHPTINLDNADPVCDLDYVPKTAREMRVRFAVSNSFGFGGHNCSLVVGALDLISMNAEFSSAEIARYSRHLIMPEVGMDGQKKLKAAAVLLIGAGGLGSPLGLYLAAAGVGRIGLVDFDVVDFSNLQRQVLHGTADVGRPKLQSAKDKLQSINPEVKLDLYETRLSAANALEIFKPYDIIIDGTDNFPTRYLVNDACVLLKKPNVYGSIFRFDGQASVFAPPLGPCYRCLYPEPPPPGEVPSCAEGGVLGILPGLIGCIQATEAVKLILGKGNPLIGRLLLYDALQMSFQEFKIRRNPRCPMCGDKPTIHALIDYNQFCGIRGQEAPAPASTNQAAEITAEELQRRLQKGDKVFILDVRNPEEYQICKIAGSTLIPLSALPQRFGELDKYREMVVHCKSGMRSAKAIQFLKQQGFTKLINLKGGIISWVDKVDPTMPKY